MKDVTMIWPDGTSELYYGATKRELFAAMYLAGNGFDGLRPHDVVVRDAVQMADALIDELEK